MSLDRLFRGNLNHAFNRHGRITHLDSEKERGGEHEFRQNCKDRFHHPSLRFFLFLPDLRSRFQLPAAHRQVFFNSEAAVWIRAAFCLVGLLLMSWRLAHLGGVSALALMRMIQVCR